MLWQRQPSMKNIAIPELSAIPKTKVIKVFRKCKWKYDNLILSFAGKVYRATNKQKKFQIIFKRKNSFPSIIIKWNKISEMSSLFVPLLSLKDLKNSYLFVNIKTTSTAVCHGQTDFHLPLGRASANQFCDDNWGSEATKAWLLLLIGTYFTPASIPSPHLLIFRFLRNLCFNLNPLLFFPSLLPSPHLPSPPLPYT